MFRRVAFSSMLIVSRSLGWSLIPPVRSVEWGQKVHLKEESTDRLVNEMNVNGDSIYGRAAG